MSNLLNKNIILGVTGGIAAYKSAELTRLLIKQGAHVRVVMTPAACEFIQPLTFQALSGNEVATQLLDEKAEAAMGHIELARWADAIIVAPATADFIAKLNAGFADNLLLTLILACNSPIFIAPAMNEKRYHQVVTQNNINELKAKRVIVFGPGSGEQACGDVGLGRMLEADDLAEKLDNHYLPKCLANKQILITAGPTHEAIDPVRYIANKSSGKMGYALAQMAIQAGAQVTLVSGPVSLEPPKQCSVIKVNSAAEMYEKVMLHIDKNTIFIACAAVADYTPSDAKDQKIKKSEDNLILNLSKTKDILADVAALNHPPFCVGFAAETQEVEHYAKKKLINKKIDLILANLVGQEQGGFASDDNAIHAFWSNGEKKFDMQPKTQLASKIIKLIAKLV